MPISFTYRHFLFMFVMFYDMQLVTPSEAAHLSYMQLVTPSEAAHLSYMQLVTPSEAAMEFTYKLVRHPALRITYKDSRSFL